MLGKLIKHEFKSTYKLVCTVYAVLIASTILGCLVMGFESLRTGKVGQTLATTFVVTYVVAIIAMFVVSFLFMCGRFYKTMYCDQGYLTHTLPVKPVTTLNAKLFVAAIWMVASGVMMILSVFALFFSGAGSEILEVMGSIRISDVNEACMATYGYSFFETIGIALLYIIVGVLYSLLFIYVSLSIGQLFNSHKIGASVGAGVIIYFIMQIASASGLVFFADRMAVGYVESYEVSSYMVTESIYGASAETIATLHQAVWGYLGGLVVFGILFYLGCYFITKKHVNLD